MDNFKNTSGMKVKRIIEKNFDCRVSMMVIQYLMDKGIENLKEATEDDILSVEGNGLMTAAFVQSLVRTAVIIAKECNIIDDILPFIVMELYVPNAKTKEISLYKEDFPQNSWNEILNDLDLEDEEFEESISNINLTAVIRSTYK